MPASTVRALMRTLAVVPMVWNSIQVLDYVRKVVQEATDSAIEDDMDIFKQGGDGSFQATYIRNSLVHALSQVRQGAGDCISQNFVSANPTIAKLAEKLLALGKESPSRPIGDGSLHKLQEMARMISESSGHFPEHRPNDAWKVSSGDVVLLTGSTGGLGSQLLARLASSPDVSHVYALNRKSKDGSASLRSRQTDALLERGLDVGIIDLPKVTLVEGDTNVKDLGIDPVLFSKIRNHTTLIIHNAWKVNFLDSLVSFKSNIRSIRTLIDLALGSPRPNPPRFIFASSVTVFKNLDVGQGRPLEAQIEDPTLALGCGYSESKLVGERILENAARATSLSPTIVRIGQLTGAANGAWNYRDWAPLVALTGCLIGVLPTRDDCIAWLSLEIAADAIFDFRNSKSQYLHLAHPNPVPWNTVFDVFASRLNVPLVSWNEWHAKLEKAYGEYTPFRLFDIFRQSCHPGSLENREAPGLPLMDMQQALESSPSLSNPALPKISRDDAERWIRYWRKIGFLSKNTVKL